MLPIGGCSLLVIGQTPGPTTLLWIFSLITLGFGICLLAAVYGLWTTQSWARNLTSGIYLAFIPWGLIGIFPIFPGTPVSLENTVQQIIGIVIDVMIVAYMAKPAIKLLFEGERQTRESLAEYERREPH